MDRERFRGCLMVEDINRTIWSAVILLGIFRELGYSLQFSVMVLVGTLHLLLTLFILSQRKVSNYLFYACPILISMVDVVYITAAISQTGLVDSYVFMIYIFPIAFWSIRYGVRGAVTITLTASLLYFAVIYLNLGLLPLKVLLRIAFYIYFSLYLGFLSERAGNGISRLATKDGLTSLYNQAYFYDNLAYLINLASKNDQTVSIALLDLDNFKQHNDQLGHLKGDRLLQEVSTLIQNNIRATDIAARYGGDEFVIIFPNADSGAAIQISERIRQSIERDIESPNDLSLSVSVGIAVFPYDGSDPWDLFNAADKSLYQAKNQGKNIVVHHPNAV